MSNFLKTTEARTPYTALQESRQLADAQTAIYLAKQFPRDEGFSLQRILNECANTKIAEAATYSFARGDSVVKGASIRLAEVIARHWGNFSSGVDEVEQRKGESVIKAYAWDYESNYRDEKIFTVKHERVTRKKTYELTDPRDIYEAVANSAARRKRACILAVIPSYVVDEALEACQKTLEASVGTGEALEENKNRMTEAFKAFDERITEEALAAKIGKDYDKFDKQDIVKMRHLYNAIKEGFVKAGAVFDFEAFEAAAEEKGEIDKLNKQLIGTDTDE